MEQTPRHTQMGEQHWLFHPVLYTILEINSVTTFVPSHGLAPDQMAMEEPSHAHRTGVS